VVPDAVKFHAAACVAVWLDNCSVVLLVGTCKLSEMLWKVQQRRSSLHGLHQQELQRDQEARPAAKLARQLEAARTALAAAESRATDAAAAHQESKQQVRTALLYTKGSGLRHVRKTAPVPPAVPC
jgi:hypothetical protein